MRKGEVPGPNLRTVKRGTIRRSTLLDLGLLVRHRRGMWSDIAQFSKADLDAADRAYRHWATTQMKSNRFTNVSASNERRRCDYSLTGGSADDGLPPPGKRPGAPDDGALRGSTQAFKYDFDL